MKFTSPVSGKVVEINRGAKRVLQSVVIEVAGDDQVTFDKFEANQLASLNRDAIKTQLVESGLWTAFRTRPFSKVPAIDSTSEAIFVTAMDTNPLAAEPTVVINEQSEAFVAGLDVLSALTTGKVYVCKKGTSLPRSQQPNVEEHVFDGPHPAGLAGTHMHFLYPVSADTWRGASTIRT